MRAVDPNKLELATARLGEAAVDPAVWPEILHEISMAAGAEGAILLQGDVRTADVPFYEMSQNSQSSISDMGGISAISARSAAFC